MNSEQTVEAVYKAIFSRKKKIIGWGTGSFFTYYYRFTPVQLEYIVDNNPERWGDTICGIEIKSPESLAKENPEDLVVVIYSSFMEQISEQIKTMGDFSAVCASLISGYEEVCIYKQKMLDRVEESSPLERKPNGRRAIIIQGPVASEFAVANIRFYSHVFPEDAIIVSTWEASNPLLIKQVEQYADHVLLNTPPGYSGHQNRNYQIASTLAGLKKAQELGVQFGLKTRTDLALLSSDLLSGCENLLELYDASATQSLGLKNRLIIPEIYTRKYIMYHPGDLMMFGHIEDMLKFWDIAYDERQIDILDPEWRKQSLSSIASSMGPAESYLGAQFSKKIGRPMLNTLEDSWDFLRDHFVVVDSSWLGMFWYKYPRLVNMQIENKNHYCVNNYFWQSLYFGSADTINESQLVDIESVPWDDFLSNKNKRQEEVFV